MWYLLLVKRHASVKLGVTKSDTFTKSFISKKVFFVTTLAFVCFEVSLNAFYQVDGIAKEWVFATRSSYSSHLDEIDKLVNYSKKENIDFFRT